MWITAHGAKRVSTAHGAKRASRYDPGEGDGKAIWIGCRSVLVGEKLPQKFGGRNVAGAEMM